MVMFSLTSLFCWFALLHLSPGENSRRFNLDIGSVLWTQNTAWLCPAPWPHLYQSPHLKSCLPTWLVTSLPQHGQLQYPGWEGPRIHSLLQGDKLSSCQTFLAGPTTTLLVQFQEHWNIPVCYLPKTYLSSHLRLAGLLWGHYKCIR